MALLAVGLDVEGRAALAVRSLSIVGAADAADAAGARRLAEAALLAALVPVPAERWAVAARQGHDPAMAPRASRGDHA